MKNSGFQNFAKPSDLNAGDDDDEEENRGTGCCDQSWCWWIPKQKSLSVAFCNETSIHGFKFLGQEKRHMSERIFWLVGFFLSLGTACYLIYGVYERYQRIPVIVSFQASEQDVDSIPFPAVTLCNMNKFPRSTVEKLQKIAADPSHKDNIKAKKELIFVRNACNAQQSFSKDFDFAFTRGTNKKKKGHIHDANETELSDDDQLEMTDFLLRSTISCDQLIRLCLLGEEKKDCGKLFHPIITDYGKCCVFNILPLPLLLKNPEHEDMKNASRYDLPILGKNAKQNWPEAEVKEWEKWNYDDGFVIPPKLNKPWRQKRAGLPYGLSILLDPNTEDYYCPAADSMGLRYILHTPLEMPQVLAFSSMAHLNKEVLIEVHPDVTNADDDIRHIEPEKRLCFFGRERTLRYFGPYTGGNCVEECTADVLTKKCNCTAFYMPRDDGVRICDSDPTSHDFNCTEFARMDLQANLKEECGHCETLCEDIAYNYETTVAELQNWTKLWGDPNPLYYPDGPPAWAKHKMSVVHIFFGAESTVPKFRKRLYGTTDLIANTGGILGLCLGFSILSGVEVVYFFTLRAFWKYCRKRKLKQQKAQDENSQANNFLSNLLFPKSGNKVIELNPNMIPVYPHDIAAHGKWKRQNGPIMNGTGPAGWGNQQGHHFYGANSFLPKNGGNANYNFY